MGKSIRYVLLALIILKCLITSSAGAQSNPHSLSEKLEYISPDSSFRIRLRPVLQNQLIILRNEKDDLQANVINRRTRFYFKGFFLNPKFNYKIQLRFEKTNQTLYDAAFKYHINKNWSFWFGQENLPAARSQLVSLKYLQFVERSAIHSIFDIQKDLGLWGFYKKKFSTKSIKLAFAISEGEGIFRPANNKGLSYTGRIDFLPFGAFENNGDIRGSNLMREESPKVAVGTAFSFNKNANAHRAQRGIPFPDNVTTDISTWYIDGIVKYRGFSAMIEYIRRETPNPVLEADKPVFDGSGFNIQGGYLTTNNLEWSFRYAGLYTDDSIEDSVESENNYTIGLSKFFRGHNVKLQGNLVYTDINNKQLNDRIELRLQMHIML